MASREGSPYAIWWHMHLREVHMENFKSFGRKLSVPFEPGFTGITGPNGSGKSNIGDAILFVLGPNSPRAIRAGRLTDLIFNGGEHGKAARGCQVSLVFDNRDRTMPVDADTVTLTRKVKMAAKKDDPDGYNSYFYVNGRASRKKEFVDLLQHARISADGYNITQQGDVLNICRMSNVERRKVLDDIAGVTAFDQDIESADKRRAQVQENLERIEIVLEEIGRDLQRLEGEKASAQRHQELKQEIGRTKGLLAWRRREDLQQQLAAAQQQIDEQQRRRQEHDAQRRDVEAKVQEANHRFLELQQKIREAGGEEVAELQERIKEARDRMVRLEEKINFARSELQEQKEDGLPQRKALESTRRELERATRQRDTQATAHDEAAKELGQVKDERDALRDRISRSDQGAMELNRELAKLKHAHEEGETRLHQARLEAERLDSRAEELERRLAEAQAEAQAIDQDLQEAEWQLKELDGATKGTGDKRKKAEKRVFELRREQAELAKQSEDLEQRIRRFQRELAELRVSQEAAARHAGGFGHAVQEVLAARDSGEIRGIVGTIAELADADQQYEGALQTAAGARMQSIVVEDDSVAAQCIEMLKQKRAGRVTVLPLNKMVPGRPRGQALMKVKQEGSLGFALDLIDYNPRYQNAFWHVFGDTLVARDMAAGRRLMGGVRIVTVDGELFESSGAMTGGASGKKRDGPSFSNTDRGRMDELLQQVADAEDKQQGLAERLVTLREELQAQQDVLEEEGRQGVGAEERLKELQARRTSLTAKARARLEAVQALEQDLTETRTRHDEAQETLAGLQAMLADMERQREEKGRLLLRGTKKELREAMEALEKRIDELTEAVLRAENRRDVAAQQVTLVQERVQELETAIATAAQDATRHEEDIKRHKEAHGKAKAEMEALMKLEKEATKELSGLQDEKDATYARLVDLKGRKDTITTRIDTMFSIITTAKAKLPVIEESLAEAMVEMREHAVEVAADEDVPPHDELKRFLRERERMLDELGPVNMRALEEFEEKETRQKSLQDEVGRLAEQRAELDKLVSEITTRKKAVLMEVFTAINENFAKVYARLSMGGKALMELEDAEDPFAGGLILKAQPMGKRVTRLDALSGGEKSLTSMAFIFAIQMYDPSPFYYFDEVDQNLDAVNSELLAKLVRDNSRFAQFIVVSLRKITLKEASHIYGVTQQTPGQSEIIANFDIDTLPGEEENDGGDGGGGTPTTDADDDVPLLMQTNKRRETRETTIGDVLGSMIQVETKQ